jgi:isopentenyldiphosphate isomerase
MDYKTVFQRVLKSLSINTTLYFEVKANSSIIFNNLDRLLLNWKAWSLAHLFKEVWDQHVCPATVRFLLFSMWNS